jgi:hypothetical protein
MRRLFGNAVAALVLFTAMGCAVRSYGHFAPPPPPPPRGVTVVRYHAGRVWIPGYYRWTGNHYKWVPGHWAKPPRHGQVWVPGYRAVRRGGYVWVEGYWR